MVGPYSLTHMDWRVAIGGGRCVQVASRGGQGHDHLFVTEARGGMRGGRAKIASARVLSRASLEEELGDTVASENDSEHERRYLYRLRAKPRNHCHSVFCCRLDRRAPGERVLELHDVVGADRFDELPIDEVRTDGVQRR